MRGISRDALAHAPHSQLRTASWIPRSTDPTSSWPHERDHPQFDGGTCQRRKRPGTLTDWETALAPGKGLSDFLSDVNMTWQGEPSFSFPSQILPHEGDFSSSSQFTEGGGELQRRRCDATTQFQLAVPTAACAGNVEVKERGGNAIPETASSALKPEDAEF